MLWPVSSYKNLSLYLHTSLLEIKRLLSRELVKKKFSWKSTTWAFQGGNFHRMGRWDMPKFCGENFRWLQNSWKFSPSSYTVNRHTCIYLWLPYHCEGRLPNYHIARKFGGLNMNKILAHFNLVDSGVRSVHTPNLARACLRGVACQFNPRAFGLQPSVRVHLVLKRTYYPVSQGLL